MVSIGLITLARKPNPADWSIVPITGQFFLNLVVGDTVASPISIGLVPTGKSNQSCAEQAIRRKYCRYFGIGPLKALHPCGVRCRWRYLGANR